MASHRRKIQGEFFDCTIQSYNDNGHGTHKIDYALQYGISIPLLKYIEELEMIFENTNDDKSEKRTIRLEFLKNAVKFDVLANYFQHLTTYLNGGSNFPDCNSFGSNFEDNKLIIITAGGNIITIFAKLLQDLIYNKHNVWFNRVMLNDWILQSQLLEFIKNCYKINPYLLEQINDLSSYDFSDFDYNILPNKCINDFGSDDNNDYGNNNNNDNGDGYNNNNGEGYNNNNGEGYDNNGEGYDNNGEGYNNNGDGEGYNNNGDGGGNKIFYYPDPKPDETCGFYLFRIKTSFSVDAYRLPYDYNLSQGRKNCIRAGISRNKLNLFYPQAAQEDWMEDDGLYGSDDKYQNKKKCSEIIENMLIIKELIKSETLNNVNTCIELKKQEFGYRSDVTGAMEYIRSVNLAMNKKLQLQTYDLTGEQTYDDTFEEWQYFLNNFSSLETILNSNLPLISIELIKEFTLEGELGNFNNNVMDYREREEELPTPDLCKYLIVPGNLYYIIKKLKGPMDKFLKSKRYIPIDGLSITFNSIIIEPRENVGDLIPKIFAEGAELDELIKSFDQLSTDSPEINQELLDFAREQLEYESGAGAGVEGRTKKLKKTNKSAKKTNKSAKKTNKSAKKTNKSAKKTNKSAKKTNKSAKKPNKSVKKPNK